MLHSQKPSKIKLFEQDYRFFLAFHLSLFRMASCLFSDFSYYRAFLAFHLKYFRPILCLVSASLGFCWFYTSFSFCFFLFSPYIYDIISFFVVLFTITLGCTTLVNCFCFCLLFRDCKVISLHHSILHTLIENSIFFLYLLSSHK